MNKDENYPGRFLSLARLVALVGLILILSLMMSSAVFARDDSAFVRQVGKIESENLGLSNPAGLAFSPEVSFAQPEALEPSEYVASLVRCIDTSQFDPPNAHSTGLTYLESSNTLMISDADVEETPFFEGDNLFEMDLSGTLVFTSTTLDDSYEPEGLGYNPVDEHLFFVDDDLDRVFEVAPGADGKHGTVDDIITFFDTGGFDSNKPLGIAYSGNPKTLFIADFSDAEVYKLTPGSNGVFDGVPPEGNDEWTSFDTQDLTLGVIDYNVTNLEGIAFNSENDLLYLTGTVNGSRGWVVEMTTDGTLVRIIDISAAGFYLPASVTFAPSSLNPSVMHIYIGERGGTLVNDGMVCEMILPPPDTTPPGTTLTSTPPDPDNDDTPTFTFTGSDSGSSGLAGFECRVDGGSWYVCSSPDTTASLSDGERTFEVRAVDYAANRDPSPAYYDWTLDTTPPYTSLTSTPPDPDNDTTPTFSFSGSDPGGSGVAGFECQVDSGSWYACSSSHTTSPLSEGIHTFRVRSVDEVGNADPSPASHTWTIDTTPPGTILTSTPPDPDNDNTPTFYFYGLDPGGSGLDGFQCQVDSGSWYVCTSPHTTSSLGEGTHTFRVRAVDNAGNTDGSPASHTWTIDTTPPYTSLTSTPPDPDNDTTPTFSFSGSDPGGSGVDGFQCQVDGGGWANCSSPYTTPSLSDGGHTFRVRSVDNAGNADPSPATYTWSIDTTPPGTILTSTPPDPDNDDTPTFYFSGFDSGGSGLAGFQCRVDGGRWTTCSSPHTTSPLSDGLRTFEVRAVDNVGNADPSPVSYAWTVDTTPPNTSLTATPPDPDNDNTPTFSFGGSDPGGSGVDGFQCQLDGSSWYNCSSPYPTPGLSDGDHTFSVRSVDNAGNTDPTPASYTWLIDTAPPSTTLTSMPSDPDNDNTPDFSFTGSDPGSSGLAGFQCQVDGGGWTNCSSPHTTSPLSDGLHTLEVRAVDNAGNADPTPASYTWTVDTTPPNAVDDSGTSYTTDEKSAFTTGDVLDNDSDPGGGPIALVSYDASTLAGMLTDNGDGTFDYDPDDQFEYLGAGAEAEDIFAYTITDAVDLSDSAQVIITITGVNDGPTISDIPDQVTRAGVPTGPVAFTVDDIDTPSASLSLSFTTSNSALVDPLTGVTFGGSGTDRTLFVTPTPGIMGTAVVTVTVSDGDLEASEPFVLTVEPHRSILPLIFH
jgi:VCBS repeat-containing protein